MNMNLMRQTIKHWKSDTPKNEKPNTTDREGSSTVRLKGEMRAAAAETHFLVIRIFKLGICSNSNCWEVFLALSLSISVSPNSFYSSLAESERTPGKLLSLLLLLLGWNVLWRILFLDIFSLIWKRGSEHWPCVLYHRCVLRWTTFTKIRKEWKCEKWKRPEKNKLRHVILKTALIYQWSHGTSIYISPVRTHSHTRCTQNTKGITVCGQCRQKKRNKTHKLEEKKTNLQRDNNVMFS